MSLIEEFVKHVPRGLFVFIVFVLIAIVVLQWMFRVLRSWIAANETVEDLQVKKLKLEILKLRREIEINAKENDAELPDFSFLGEPEDRVVIGRNPLALFTLPVFVLFFFVVEEMVEYPDKILGWFGVMFVFTIISFVSGLWIYFLFTPGSEEVAAFCTIVFIYSESSVLSTILIWLRARKGDLVLLNGSLNAGMFVMILVHAVLMYLVGTFAKAVAGIDPTTHMVIN